MQDRNSALREGNKTIHEINEQQQITLRMTPNTPSSKDDAPPPPKKTANEILIIKIRAAQNVCGG